MEKESFSTEDSGQVYRDSLAKELKEIKNDPKNKDTVEAREKMKKFLGPLKKSWAGDSDYKDNYHSAKVKHLAKVESKKVDSMTAEEREKKYEYFIHDLFGYSVEKEDIDNFLSAMNALIDTGMIREDLIASRRKTFIFDLDLQEELDLDPKLYKVDEIKRRYNEIKNAFFKVRNVVCPKIGESTRKNYFSAHTVAYPKYLIGQDMIGLSKIYGGYSTRHPEYVKQREENFNKFIEGFKRTPEEIKELEDNYQKLLEKDKNENEPYIRDYKEKYTEINTGNESLDKKEKVRRSYVAWANCFEELSDLYQENKDYIERRNNKSNFFEFLSKLDAVNKLSITKKLLELSLTEKEACDGFQALLNKLGLSLGYKVMFDWDIVEGGERTAKEFLWKKPDMVLIAPNSGNLPAVIAKEVIKQEKVKKTFNVPEDYNPYFSYPKTRVIREMIESGRNDMDFSELVDKYASFDDIPKATKKDKQFELIRKMYHEIEGIESSIELKIKTTEGRPFKVMVFDESVLTGKTLEALASMVKGAVKLLVKKGIIKSEDEISIIGSSRPFGGYKPQFPKIVLAGEDGLGTYKDNLPMNQILFKFGKIIGRNIAEQICIEKKSK